MVNIISFLSTLQLNHTNIDHLILENREKSPALNTAACLIEKELNSRISKIKQESMLKSRLEKLYKKRADLKQIRMKKQAELLQKRISFLSKKKLLTESILDRYNARIIDINNAAIFLDSIFTSTKTQINYLNNEASKCIFADQFMDVSSLFNSTKLLLENIVLNKFFFANKFTT
jgi:hypothetical protein